MNRTRMRRRMAAGVAIMMLLVLLGQTLPQIVSFFGGLRASAATPTLNVPNLWNNKMTELGWISGSSPTENMWHSYKNNDDELLQWIDPEESGAQEKVTTSDLGQRITEPVIATSTTEVQYVSDRPYVGSRNDSMYYTIEYEESAGGAYRNYYITTADQLARVFYNYHSSRFNNVLKAKESDLIKPDGTRYTAAAKVKVTLLNDLDLGGANSNNNRKWQTYGNTGVYLEIDGNGNTIYNGYFTNYFLGGSDQYFAIHDLTFSNMYIPRAGGMFGTGVSYAYFENVNWENCLSTYGSAGVSIVLGHSYYGCYFKDCMIRDSYTYGIGHCSLFASYNGATTSGGGATYLEDTSVNNTVRRYYTTVPGLEKAQIAWKGGKITENGTEYTLTASFPTIYENCATLDSEVYDISNHSGTFVSCMQGNIIFKNCFTNCTIFGSLQCGTFLGCVIGCTDGFYHEVDGKKTLVNVYFENCYSSGAIEGSTSLGGFIGGIYDDGRSITSNMRGQAAFVNCYSTSSVGMQYSGNNLGGFVGRVYGNVRGAEGTQSHIFINCYAAGEVGSILTNTSNTNNTESVGGFFGSYMIGQAVVNDYIGNVSSAIPYYETSTAPILKNCYYDKQTTAMRERAIGGTSKNGEEYQNQNYPGLTGVYTLKSDLKQVAGLVNDVKMDDDTAWWNLNQYYPQLKVFSGAIPNRSDYADGPVGDMYYQRAVIYYNYSFASTATVFLDHYDQIMTEQGEEEDGINDGVYVYDTVRDITRKFEFTSNSGGHTLTWETDSARNASSGFVSKMGQQADGSSGFSMQFTAKAGQQTVSYTPNVLTIDKDGDTYKCFDFAPGKQWVKITTDCNQILDGSTAGIRRLRLLPTAYLNAGEMFQIEVERSTDDNTLTNQVTVGNTNPVELSKFNHSYGVAYAITDKHRMIDDVIYPGQVLSPYSDSNKTSFALYGGYLLTESESASIGLGADGNMQPQQFLVTGQDNNSSNGMTVARVYETEVDSTNHTLVQGKAVSLTGETLEKWQGQRLFEEEDQGFYYIVYHWRLNDGRYLEDIRLVRITAVAYTAEIVTGILDQTHTVDDSADPKTAIDQYVTDDFEIQDGTLQAHIEYPSSDPGFSAANAATYYNQETGKTYNTPKTYSDGRYYTKSLELTTRNASVVAWKHTDEMCMTNLIIEVQDETGTWQTLEQTATGSGGTGESNIFDFTGAQYTYYATSYSISQDEETKLFKVYENPNAPITLTVQSVGSDSSNGITEQYMVFDFDPGHDDVITEANKNIRVTALFRETGVAVTAEKTVLLELTGDQDDILAKYATGDKALDVGEASKEVDNTHITSTSDKDQKAVLPGDILTYRIKLYNTRLDPSDQVVVNDQVPEGCTYVTDSMRIYRQSKTTDNTYGKLENCTNSAGMATSYTPDTRLLTWTIPTIDTDEDYYVEYRVKVDDIGAATVKKTLVNTADYSCTAIFGDQTVDLSMEMTADGVYQVVLQNIESGTRTIDSVALSLPEGFTQGDVTLSYTEHGAEMSQKLTETTADGSLVIDRDLAEEESLTLQIEGTQGDVPAETPLQLDVRFSFHYQVGADNTTNNVFATARHVLQQTNQVSTDATWLYLQVEKTIPVADPGQSFLFQIAYYGDNTDTPVITYTKVNCTDPVTDPDGNITGYTGTNLIQCAKRGRYVVTEVTSWSQTDYEFGIASGSDISNNGYPSDAQRGGIIQATDCVVAIYLPRLQYGSGTYPTAMGTDPTAFPTAAYTNTESPYAYLSGQAYGDNTIHLAAADTG